MKRLLLLVMLFAIVIFAKANPVDQKSAKEIGKNFLKVSADMKIADSDDLQLVTTYNTNDGDVAFYIFNAANGFVIVSAMDYAIPILGYSDEGRFETNNIPIQMEEYLQGFVEQIQYGKDHNLIQNEETALQWELVRTTGRINNERSTDVVEPLLTTTWGQGSENANYGIYRRYNIMCPADASGPNGHTIVGCTATAAAQIMRYWSYPTTGNGSHSYTPSNYPQQSANFGATTYDWANMPNELNSSSTTTQNNAVALISWHVGVAIDTEYGPDGSSAVPAYVPAALVDYFRYDSDLYSAYKNDYSNATWLNMVKSSLNQSKPVFYAGWNSSGGGGHSFVCDGYNSSNQLHFNWGWNGSENNYFSLGALIAGGYDFSYNNFAIFNIHPIANPNVTYQINATASPTTGGTVAGTGTYQQYQMCTLTATPATGFEFRGWKENNIIVSTAASYTFPAMQNRTLVAVFSLPSVSYVTANYYPDANDPNSPYVEVSWGAPTPGEGQWYYYGDETLATNVGANGPFYWAVMFPAGTYTGNMVTKVATYATSNETFTGTVTIYNDGTTEPQTEVGSMDITVPNISDMYEMEFPTPVIIDPTKNLWVVMYNASSSSWVAGACTDAGDANARWLSINGSSWMDLANAGVPGYSWILQAYIAQSSPTPPTPPSGDNATIILTAGDVWGDGSGYQMLLDNTHSLYGTTIPTSGALSDNCSGNESIYAQFSNKIPENADGNCSTGNIVINNSVSITIPAGTYDWCITNPTPGDRIWIAASNGDVGGRQDDYVFEAGNVYEFTVSMFGTNDGVDVTITGGAKNNHKSIPQDMNNCRHSDRNITDTPQIQYYKVYRAECNSSTNTLIANNQTGSSFVDNSWSSLGFGSYKYGVSTVSTTNVESNIIWSDCIDKGTGFNITATANPTAGGTVTGGGLYEQGATCTLTATPNTGYSFVNWTKNGNPVSTNASYSFTVSENASYVANFNLITYTVTATANPSNGGNVTGGGTYNQGATCTLTATPNAGYTFVNWTKNGNPVSTNASYSFTVNESATYVANFNIITYNITATANPTEGGTVSGSNTYNHGATCTLTATPNNDWNFINWTKNGNVVSANASYSFTVTENANYVANFSQNVYYTIVASAYPAEGGNVTGGGTFLQGETCNLSATANPGYTFVNWTKNGNVVSTNNSYSFVVNETNEYIANFSRNSFTITAIANPEAGATIYGGGTYYEGETCTLTLQTNTYYTFLNWTENGTVVSTNDSYSFTVTANRNIVANLEYFDAIDANTANAFAIYPNPVSDKLMVESQVNIEKCEIYTISGSLIISKTENSKSFEIEVGDLKAGSYIIRLTTDDKVKIMRFIKK